MSVEDESVESGDRELPRTFVHDLVTWLPTIDKERVRFIDLSKRQISPPPYGFSVGENMFIIGAGKKNPDAQYLVTDKLLDCTAIVIEDNDSEKYLLAHTISAHSVHHMFEKFREALGNPEKVKSVTVIPGYNHSSPVDARIQAILTQGMKLNPDQLVIDVASGVAGDYRGIVQDTIGGGLYGLRQPVDPDIAKRYSNEWSRHVLR